MQVLLNLDVSDHDIWMLRIPKAEKKTVALLALIQHPKENAKAIHFAFGSIQHLQTEPPRD